MRIVTVVGARPQFIKAAAVSRAFRRLYPDDVEELIIHTGQHYDENMSQVFFDELDLPHPSFHLEIGSLSHSQQTGRMAERIEKLLQLKRPDAVIVYGDTNSTLAGALAASKIHIPVVHVEAGLRSFRKTMPEEINRVLTDHVSTFLFSPTERGIRNLIREGFAYNHYPPYNIDNPAINNFGDVMYDNSLYYSELADNRSAISERLALSAGPYVLSTIHRANNTGEPERLKEIIRGLKEIANTGMRVIIPLHPRTRKHIATITNKAFIEGFETHKRIDVIEPVSFLDMIMLEKKASMIITDSGGVQKEAYFFNKPSVVLREETEWTEVIEHGAGRLAGADAGRIYDAFSWFRNHPPEAFPNVFGEGNAAARICREIVFRLT